MFSISPKMAGENNKQYAYRVIKNAIMFLELKPGQVVSEIDLAEVLKVSRTPIREVLGKLREENLVEVIPQVGTNVAKINVQLIEEAAFMRYILEKEIMKKACLELPDEAMQLLEHNIRNQELLIGKKENEREFHKLDNEFHYIIYRGLRKENIWLAIKRISTHYNRIRILSEMEHSFDDAIEQHKKIVKILKNRQVDQIEKIVEEHIVAPMKLWENLTSPDSPYAEYFEFESDSVPYYTIPVF